MAEDKFINPYNFIPFPKVKASSYTETDRHTGVIEYRIMTHTPLFIPNSSSESAFRESDKVKEHKSYDFFSYTDLDVNARYDGVYHVPVIPGSEIRGVVRNVYETLTDSCMGMLNEEIYPVKRTSEMFRPALLYRNESGELKLYKANSLRIGAKARPGSTPPGFETYKNGTEIYYEKPSDSTGRGGVIQTYTNQGKKYNDRGYLIKWGMGARKTRYHLFVPTLEIVKGIHLSRDIVDRTLMNVIKSYLEQPALTQENKKAYEDYKADLEGFLKGKAGLYFPVCYSVLKDGIIYLSPAVYSKEVANHSIGSLAGDFAPCKKDFCPACELFGYLQAEGDSSKCSKVRFTDLYVESLENPKDYYQCDKITLQALGGPKLGNVDFYLEKPEEASFWTYDYYIKDKNINMNPGKLRGRKYYWHHRNVNLPKNVEITNLNKTIRPVKPGIVFKGKLYFENISKKQLNQLIWILNSEDKELGLKIGAAKPLGLGSVSCLVENVTERKIRQFNNKLEYSVEKIPILELDYNEVGFSASVKKEYYKMAGLYSIPEHIEITYPKCSNQKHQPLTEGYKWFVENHRTDRMARKRTDMKIKYELPHILEKDLGLPYVSNAKKKTEVFNSGNKQGGKMRKR